jgi:hypothetical protein
MKKIIAISSALALGLTVAACSDGPKENAAEATGEQMAEDVNASAEAAEDAGKITDDQADAMTDAAENKADAMEKAGENADIAAGTGTATDAAKK